MAGGSGCGSVARTLLRLCAALLLALGVAMCAASAALFAQWRAQAGADTPSASANAVPWFLYCTFGAGAYVTLTAVFGLLGASTRRPRCLNAHVGLLVAGMVPQVALATVMATDPALRPPPDATGAAARLADLAARDAAAARGLAFAAAALQLLSLALAAALQPDGDDDAPPGHADDVADDAAEVALADDDIAWRVQRSSRGRDAAALRAPLLPPDAGSGGALSAEDWAERMRTRYGLDTAALTYDPRRRGSASAPPRRAAGMNASSRSSDRCTLQ